MFRKILPALLCMLLFSSTCAYSCNIKNFSQDDDIRAALRLLKNIGAEEVFVNLQENSVKIIFYDLSLIDFSYRNHFAVNSIDNWGERYILINSKFRNASKEEIACLIAHESFHKSKRATMEEETLATQKEAYYWSILKVPGKLYADTSLGKRLNKLVCLYNDSTEETNLIEKKILNSKFYQSQLAVTSKRKI
ncbi:MAG: hypothetical protein LUB59_01190 [Candidatus Gastranaerophilales bacterium]|nr:hypothetical protein [Candidatus Gastranaerophilales bacterium]